MIPDENVSGLTGPTPTETPSAADTDAFIAEEMMKLSMEDREKVYFDVHGITDEIQETPTLIEESLADLQAEITLIEDKVAYNMALQLNPTYVADRNFQLMFLRADRFDAKQAALRLARHFQAKLDLFGLEKLGRNIIQDDLNQEDLECLYSGLSTLPGYRDHAGRAIFVNLLCKAQNTWSVEARLRRLFYLSSSMFGNDLETQRKGLVAIVYGVHEYSQNAAVKSKQVTWKTGSLLKALPVRVEAMHYCSDSLFSFAFPIIFRIASSFFLRLRFRSHFGSHRERIDSLRCFGIPRDAIPVSDEGVVKKSAFRQMLEKEHRREGMTSTPTVKIPGRADVIFGRGPGNNQHTGNVRFRMLIEDCKEKYDSSTRDEKMQLTKEIVQIVKQKGGRFLRDDGEGWMEVDDEAARLKVGYTIRSLRSVPKPEGSKARKNSIESPYKSSEDENITTDEEGLGAMRSAPGGKRMRRD